MSAWQIHYQAEVAGEGRFVSVPHEIDPSLRDDEVLVEPKRMAFCGSDLHALKVYTGNNLVLGHEWTGVVKALGSKVQGLQVGDVVTSATSLGCGECEYCLQKEEHLCLQAERLGAGKFGALSSSLKLPASFLHGLAKDELDSGLLLEPLAVAQETQELLKKNSLCISGKKVLVFGAGGIGLLEAWLMKKLGADVSILEIDHVRLAFAKEQGFEAFRFEFALMDEAFKGTFDILIDAAGSLTGQKEACRYFSYFGKKRFTAVLVGKYCGEIVWPFSLMQNKQASYLWQTSLSHLTLKKTYQLYAEDLKSLASWLLHEPCSRADINKAYLMAKNRVCPPRVNITI